MVLNSFGRSPLDASLRSGRHKAEGRSAGRSHRDSKFSDRGDLFLRRDAGSGRDSSTPVKVAAPRV